MYNYIQYVKEENLQKTKRNGTRWLGCGRATLTLTSKLEMRKRYPAGRTTRPDAKSLHATSVAPTMDSQNSKKTTHGSPGNRWPHIKRSPHRQTSSISSAPRRWSRQWPLISLALGTLGTYSRLGFLAFPSEHFAFQSSQHECRSACREGR